MSATIRSSLTSVLDQLDDRFEVIVVDDGSSDNSISIILDLCRIYPNLRLIPLQRDNRRKLGQTRNLSIRAARGEFCILHIDCDDIWQPYIQTFTKVFHEIHRRLLLSDFMLSGVQIQMAPKSLLIQYPYPNIYYTEDRRMWAQLTIAGKLLILNHTPFRDRIPLSSTTQTIQKLLRSEYSGIEATFASTPSPFQTFLQYLHSIFRLTPNDTPALSCRLRLFRLFLLPFTLLTGLTLRREAPINQPKAGYKFLNHICLRSLEASTQSTHGNLPLSPTERSLFRLDP